MSLDFEILYQDEDLVAVSKRSGLFVHPYKKESNEKVTLLSLLRDHIGSWVYPINRIDRPVSGIVLFALNSDMASQVQASWNSESTKKKYIALCRHCLREPGEFNFQLKNDRGNLQDCLTCYTPLLTFSNCTLVEVEIKSGRKHQIRRHFSRRCNNLVGDTKYGKGDINREFREKHGLDRIFLHSHELSFVHPKTDELIQIKSPLSNDLKRALTSLANSERSILESHPSSTILSNSDLFLLDELET